MGERSGLQTRTAMTESVSLCTRMKVDGVYGAGSGDSSRQSVKSNRLIASALITESVSFIDLLEGIAAS